MRHLAQQLPMPKKMQVNQPQPLGIYRFPLFPACNLRPRSMTSRGPEADSPEAWIASGAKRTGVRLNTERRWLKLLDLSQNEPQMSLATYFYPQSISRCCACSLPLQINTEPVPVQRTLFFRPPSGIWLFLGVSHTENGPSRVECRKPKTEAPHGQQPVARDHGLADQLRDLRLEEPRLPALAGEVRVGAVEGVPHSAESAEVVWPCFASIRGQQGTMRF